MDLRNWLYINLDPLSWPHTGLSLLNKLIAIFVLTGVASAILETEPLLAKEYATSFIIVNKVFLYVFTLEYIMRVWAMGENVRYSGITGRLRYMVTIPAIIDIITVFPFWLGAGSEILLLRMLRLLRILKLARLPGISSALKRLYKAIHSRRIEFFLTISFALLLMVIAATTLYFIEGRVQPETFGSIPRALWWGVATLTTVGYGDVYPITTLGKFAAGVYAFAGIGLVAMPTGIFAASMSDIVQSDKK